MNGGDDEASKLEIMRNRISCDATSYTRLREIVPKDVWEKWEAVWDGVTPSEGDLDV